MAATVQLPGGLGGSVGRPASAPTARDRDTSRADRPVRVLDGRRARAVAVVRIVFGLAWLTDAALKWTPHFINGYLDHLDEGADGRPGWLQPWFRFWHDLQAPAPHAWAYFVAVTETLIALAVLFGVARKFTYLSGAVFSVMIWATAEGFGGPYAGRGADVDVSAGLIYALVFVALLLLTADGPDHYSLDTVIERHFPWWRRIAELRPARRALYKSKWSPAVAVSPAGEQRVLDTPGSPPH